MSYAYTGTDLWAASGAAAYTDFSAVMSCYPETVQVIANKDITSIDQLKGKKVSVGDAGSGVEFNATQVLAAYGIDINNDIEKNNLTDGYILKAYALVGYGKKDEAKEFINKAREINPNDFRIFAFDRVTQANI